MAKLERKVGATSEIWQIFIQDASQTNGIGLAGLAFGTSGLTAYYHRDTDTSATSITLVTMTIGSFTSSGFKEIDATNMPGWYQLCPPNAALAAGAKSCAFLLKGAANMVPMPIEVDLDAQVDVTFWNGTVVATPATAGIPDVNTKNINNVSASSVTTINANQGTTQPVNFTGTGGSALVKSDTVDIAGAAVSTSTAQLGVNVVNIGGSASTGAAGYAGVDWGQVANKTTTNALTGTTISTSQVVASVTGATGSVTGNVGGNVTGSVGSVVATVNASVTQWNGTNVTQSIPPDSIFIRSGTAQAGAASTITLDAGASAVNNFYQNEIIFLRSGTGAGQSNIITTYVGATKVATVGTAWAAQPDNTSVFSILAEGPSAASISGTVAANVTQWNGTNVASPATAGVPEVNVKNINNVTASSVTTINANQGTTQPVNFTGTAGSALVKSDTVDIAGAAVSTSTAQLGVNIVNVAGSASTGAAGYVGVDWGQLANKTTTNALTGTTISVSQTIAAITGAIASVTNVGTVASITGLVVTNLDAAVSSRMATYTQPTGFLAATFPSGTVANTTNVTAGTITLVTSTTTVGSVAGAVGSVTGNVGGNVTGSVGSVIATVTANTIQIAGAVVSPTIAQIGVNIVNIAGSASAGTAGYAGVDWGQVTNKTTTNALTGTSIAASQTITAVTGAVGSVTGNVGGNVVGSVGSVTAAVAITSNVKKNQALAAFEFVMTSSTTHIPTAGLTVTATRSLDGGSFAACANAVAEVGNGVYKIDLAATDTNANTIMLRFTATGADNRLISIVTQP